VQVAAADQGTPATTEASLKGSLPNEHPQAAAPAGPGSGLKPNDTSHLAESDYVLYNGLTVLKGMISGLNRSDG